MFAARVCDTARMPSNDARRVNALRRSRTCSTRSPSSDGTIQSPTATSAPMLRSRIGSACARASAIDRITVLHHGPNGTPCPAYRAIRGPSTAASKSSAQPSDRSGVSGGGDESIDANVSSPAIGPERVQCRSDVTWTRGDAQFDERAARVVGRLDARFALARLADQALDGSPPSGDRRRGTRDRKVGPRRPRRGPVGARRGTRVDRDVLRGPERSVSTRADGDAFARLVG